MIKNELRETRSQMLNKKGNSDYRIISIDINHRQKPKDRKRRQVYPQLNNDATGSNVSKKNKKKSIL